MNRQSEDFKTKMKVSNPLNDIAANLGVTPKVLTQLATGDDKEFRELVRGIFSILPEDEVVLVASDEGINPEFLDYLAHLFENNSRILMTILQNSSTTPETKQAILKKLPENVVTSLASSPKTSPDVFKAIQHSYKESSDILALLLANPSASEDLKEQIIAESSEDVSLDKGRFPFIAGGEEAYEAGNVDAKITLCVDKLYEVNADVVTEFIRKARIEILKRLTIIAKVNRLILKTIVQHPDLAITDLERIDMDMFASLLQQTPEEIDDQTILRLLQQKQKEKKP